MRKEGMVNAVILFLVEEDVWMDIQVRPGTPPCLPLPSPGLLKLLPLG